MFRRVLGVVAALIVGVLALQWAASESGEVVVMTTRDAAGAAVETRLWVVDLDGSAWLRAGSPDAGWYGRLVADPAIAVVRGESSGRFRAIPEPGRQAEVNRLMREKYGWADAFIGAMFDRAGAVPLRLEPVPDQPG